MYTNFEFDKHRLSDFGCIVANVNAGHGYREVDIGNKISLSTFKNNKSSKQYVVSSKYDSVYSVSLQIVKDMPRNHYNNVYFSQLEIRELMKWLNRHGYYKFQPLFDDKNDCNVHYYGSFNVDEIKLDDKTIGLQANFTSNAPFAFGDRIQFTTITSSDNEYISIYGDGDDYQPIYPDISIKCLVDGHIKITNTIYQNPEEYLFIDNCIENEIITISSEHGIITSNMCSDEEIAKSFNYNFLVIEMYEDYCENKYQVEVPCEITISYEPVRKVGGY